MDKFYLSDYTKTHFGNGESVVVVRMFAVDTEHKPINTAVIAILQTPQAVWLYV